MKSGTNQTASGSSTKPPGNASTHQVKAQVLNERIALITLHAVTPLNDCLFIPCLCEAVFNNVVMLCNVMLKTIKIYIGLDYKAFWKRRLASVLLICVLLIQ